MTTPESVIARYTDAAARLDMEALLALYHPDLRMFDLGFGWQMRGVEAWRQAVKVWFEMTGSDPRVEASEVEVRATAEMCLLTMNMAYAHTSDEGEVYRMVNRLSWALVPDGEDWLIVHEHTSAPVRMDDMTPVFDPTEM